MTILTEVQTAYGVLHDWLGEGGEPVDWRIAEHRASICATSGPGGSPCPMNVAPKWWEHAKEKAADYIREHLEVKHRSQIGTTKDSHLHMCRACGCCLPLKVHVPISHIIRHTSEETIARFPSNCWIPTELK